MIDSHTTAEYWKNRTHECLGIKMPETNVVHLGNSKDLMEVAEDCLARRVLREHIRESLGVRIDHLLFAIISSEFWRRFLRFPSFLPLVATVKFSKVYPRGKGQDLFLKAFYEALQLSKERKQKLPAMHAVVVGTDLGAQTKFETELCNFVADKKIEESVYFFNKTLMFLSKTLRLVESALGG